jgi:Transcriptional regulator
MELRDRIIEEASALFFRKGIKSITMTDIARQLGISKRTLYEIFKDKEELLESCLSFGINNTTVKTEELISRSENAIDALMRIYAHNFKEVHEMNKSVVFDLKKYHPRLYKMIEWNRKEGLDLFLPLFEKGVKQGLIREDIHFEVLLLMLNAQLKMVMEGELPINDKYKLSTVVEAIILNFARGIATPLGAEKIDELEEKVKNGDIEFN